MVFTVCIFMQIRTAFTFAWPTSRELLTEKMNGAQEVNNTVIEGTKDTVYKEYEISELIGSKIDKSDLNKPVSEITKKYHAI